jgi:hypothetical protein
MVQQLHRVVCVFGSSRVTESDPQYRIARELGKNLASAGFTLCNGGYGGTMEASARGAKDAGGRSIGIISKHLTDSGANPWIDEVVVANSVMDRLMRLIERGDAYVFLQGGTGTLLELAAAWELTNKRMMATKPMIALGNFWIPLIHAMQGELVSEGRNEALRLVISVPTPKECVEILIDKFGVRYEA